MLTVSIIKNEKILSPVLLEVKFWLRCWGWYWWVWVCCWDGILMLFNKRWSGRNWPLVSQFLQFLLKSLRQRVPIIPNYFRWLWNGNMWSLFQNQVVPIMVQKLSKKTRWSLYVLPLYYRHARVFENSRQEFPCSSLPRQGKISWLLLFFFFFFSPAEESRAGEFLAGTFKHVCMMVIKRQDLK